MDIVYNSRSLYPNELKLLKSLKTKKEKEGYGKLRLQYFVIAAVLGLSLTYITTVIPDSFFTFLFGTIAVLAFTFIVFAPIQFYKLKKRHKTFLQQLNVILNNGSVQTSHIRSERIAIAPEYEDEGDLYIIELNNNHVLYLWDYNYSLKKKFPCFEFEIYEDDFFKLLGRQVYPLSEKIIPEKIDKKAKWNFLSKYGGMGHLEIEYISFDALLEKYKNCA